MKKSQNSTKNSTKNQMRKVFYIAATLVSLAVAGCGIHYTKNEAVQQLEPQSQRITLNSLDSLFFFSDASSFSSNPSLDTIILTEEDSLPRIRSATDYPISSDYGEWRKVKGPTGGIISQGKHMGIDYKAPKGTPVLADSNLFVKEIGYDPDKRGKYVKLGNDEIEIHYYHLSEINVKRGQTVKKNQVIGKVGTTGASNGYHLHIGVSIKGKNGEWEWVNPDKVID